MLKFNQTGRSAFTLIELLVVIVIMGILTAMLTFALSGARRQSQQTRAIAQVERVNLILLSLYEQETERRVTTSNRSLNSRDSNFTQIMWKRDWLRCSLPDSRQDLIDGVSTAQHLYYDSTPSVQIEAVDTAPSSRRLARLNRYRARVVRTIAALASGSSWTAPASWADVIDGNPANGEWTTRNQSGECLYLIFATHSINGRAAIDSFNSRDIGDEDGDGMPEILDPWGIPLAFMRWPVGLYLSDTWESPPTAVSQLETIKSGFGRDQLDVLYSDPRYFTATTSDDPFPEVPVVLSAGEDGAFDLAGLDRGMETVFSYGTMTRTSLPNPASAVANNYPSYQLYTVPIGFVDPYLDFPNGSLRPVSDQLGCKKDLINSGTDNSSDNVLPVLGGK